MPKFSQLLEIGPRPRYTRVQLVGGPGKEELVLARRKWLVEAVKTSLSQTRARAFRAKGGAAIGPQENPQLQRVKVAVKRRGRFRLQPVKHSESSAGH